MWKGEEYINNIFLEAEKHMDHRSNPILTWKSSFG